MTLVWKLLVLVAVLLMPLGMSGARAAPHHAAMVDMPMGHCPDQGSKHETGGGIAACTMVCAAALPAASPSGDEAPALVPVPASPSAVAALHGLHPDIATPPPKRA
jgi:hypothetical protein